MEVIESSGNGKDDCPFSVTIEKHPITQRWRVTYLNCYHNHLFKKSLDQYKNLTTFDRDSSLDISN